MKKPKQYTAWTLGYLDALQDKVELNEHVGWALKRVKVKPKAKSKSRSTPR